MKSARDTIVAIASGKGGTGKTTVAAHLALAATKRSSVLLVDLDVEAPDSTGYFPSAAPMGASVEVKISVPRLNESRCTGCGLCAAACRFGAIIAIGGVVTIDDKVCKGCGRCVTVCPTNALEEVDARVGTTAMFRVDGLGILEGRMDIGDIRSTSVIEAAKLRAASQAAGIQVRDCPPGVSCPATHAVAGADYIILVAEPTQFSLHDLGAAIELAKSRHIPMGVVVNKDGFGDADVDAFCASHGAPIIGRIAFLRSRAESGAGAKLWREDTEIMAEMDHILDTALAGARSGGQS
ncbi:MAG: 4Fe-4S binding protein [Spirochaetales bacterium]|nr:4Fe-4S binding protein [Spirochaetales bacterium]